MLSTNREFTFCFLSTIILQCDPSTKTVHNLYNRSVQGFIQRRGGPGIPSPQKEILKLSMVICVLSQGFKRQSCPRLRQK